MRWSRFFNLALFPVAVHSFASTDSIQDVDPPQSGYLPNHNIDPIALSTFKIGWTNIYNANEMFYAKPLVWTPAGAANEQVIVVSNQNIIRVLDGLTGLLLQSRTLDPPFQSVDTSCGDIPNTVGITGTPIIDSATGIMYLYSKGYKGAVVGPAGTLAGQYKLYAIYLSNLQDVPGFPVVIDGHYANNDPTRYFLGGTVLQRPALTMVGNIVLAGFGGHCDNFNYTGMLVAVSKTAGVGVTNIIAMEASPGKFPLISCAPTPQALDYTVQGGGKAGIWQTGMGLATDGNRIFFVTGNSAKGNGVNGGGIPASGKIPISTLQQAVANFGVSGSGVLTQQDYFEPYEYASLNGGDRDFGSSGAALLDPTTFSGNGVSRIIVAGGKSGKIYFMNADNLGGFAMGSGGSDAVIQTIVQTNPLFSGIGSYPLDGGYIYYCPTGGTLNAYSFSKDSSGNPSFKFAGSTVATFAGEGVPTITSLNGQPGTGVVWMSDVNLGLVAYNAIPVNNTLVPIKLGGATGRLQKYQRPAFGNARVYTTITNKIYGIGGTTATAALTCATSPIAFGSVGTGQTSVIQVNCKAGGTALTLKGCTTGLATFQCSGIPTTVAAGGGFAFPATFNLTDAAIEAARLATPSYQVTPGVSEGAALNILNSAGTSLISIALTGTPVASGGFIVLNATQVDFGGVTLGSTVSSAFIVSNKGQGPLTFVGFAWKDLTVSSSVFQNVTGGVVGKGYTATSFPTQGQTLAPGASITIPLTFNPTVSGTSSSLLAFWTDSDYTDVMLVGTASGGTSGASSSSVTATTSKTSSSSKISSSSSVKSSSVSSSKTTTSSSQITSSTYISSSSVATSSSMATSSSSISILISISSSSTSSPVVVASSTTSSFALSSLSSSSSSTTISTSPSSTSTPSSSSVAPSSSSTYPSTSSSSSSYFAAAASSSTSTSNSTTDTASACSTSAICSTSTTLVTITTTVSLSSSSSTSLSIHIISTSSSPSSTTTIPSTSTSTSISSPTPTATGLPIYTHIGCFAEPPGGHALPKLLANDSVTPDLCVKYVQGLFPGQNPFAYVEYHRECYGGTSFTFGTAGVTSFYGKGACTDICSGSVSVTNTASTTAYCGGWAMFDLYAASSIVDFGQTVATVSK